ncbi:bifunctional UDP-N-acetylglucosamine diphosphorylase/glucosamine-1-phosphate N-acetyltransferase GlmU [Alphaproteobacteria bacterium]|nr:bifunctional UDP-N-acetylglucosamine diphosphorylase/glucosamine-1-phosphate N-acetyltransferase GlmU [Alphaproteobacteria bacterium]
MSIQNPLAIIILAAGKGTRMKSDKPKVMNELAGLPMVNWLLKTAESLKPEKIVVVTGPDMKHLEEAVKPHITVIQETRNGTGGAARIAAEKLGAFKGNVLILLGDAPLIRKETLESLITARQGKDIGLSLLGCDIRNPTSYGRIVLANDSGSVVEKIVEEKDASIEEKKIKLVNTGAFCVDGENLSKWLQQITNDNAAGEFYITDLPQIAAKQNMKTTAAITHDQTEVQGCNTLLDLAALETTLRLRLCGEAMAAGVKIIDPATTYLHHDTKIGAGTLVEPNVFFGEKVEIGENVHLKAFSHLEDVTIAKNATIGPFARLRPGTQIEEGVRIGNFVEIKKSTIGKHSKVPHLAYVGDTTMGKDVNFSAGAITVNYDGFEKHQTIIGKGVMIGSNVNLVAPIEIDDGALVAAGSTITSDVPADSLSIARDTGSIRQGWAKAYREKKRKKKK